MVVVVVVVVVVFFPGGRHASIALAPRLRRFLLLRTAFATFDCCTGYTALCTHADFNSHSQVGK